MSRSTKNIIANMAIPVVIAALAIGLSIHAAQNRIFLDRPEVLTVQQPHDALRIWTEKGVRGRILVIFDRRFNITYPGSVSPATTPDMLDVPGNYVYLATARNIVRSIYHVVPDAAWPEVQEALRTSPVVDGDGARYRMAVFDGIALHIMRLQDLPALDERILLLINGTLWDEKGVAEIAAVLGGKRIASDLVILAGPGTDNSRRKLEGYAKNPI